MLQLTATLYGLLFPWRDDCDAGQGLVEYILILGFVSIAVIVALIYFRTQLTPLYSKVGSSIP